MSLRQRSRNRRPACQIGISAQLARNRFRTRLVHPQSGLRHDTWAPGAGSVTNLTASLTNQHTSEYWGRVSRVRSDDSRYVRAVRAASGVGVWVRVGSDDEIVNTVVCVSWKHTLASRLTRCNSGTHQRSRNLYGAEVSGRSFGDYVCGRTFSNLASFPKATSERRMRVVDACVRPSARGSLSSRNEPTGVNDTDDHSTAVVSLVVKDIYAGHDVRTERVDRFCAGCSEAGADDLGGRGWVQPDRPHLLHAIQRRDFRDVKVVGS